MNHSFRSYGTTALRSNLRRIVAISLPLFTIAMVAHAGNLTRGSISGSRASGSGSAGGSSSQTTTTATTATSQASQAAAMAQLAQVSMQRSVQSLQALQSQASAQSAARNLAIGAPSNVPDGLAVGGLVPGITGVDAANPASTALSLPVTLGANGTASVNLAANTALTLPPSAAASSQITVSGTGTVGTITTGNIITSITAGVAITAPPGSTISLTKAGTISFASSSSVPTTVATYALPASWSGVGGLTQSTYSPTTGTANPTSVTITQTQQQAVLTWQTFNIGKNTTLDFDQSAGGANVSQWVAINKVAPNIAPSLILGSIQAPGQVYVVNQNGIIFTGSSQINVGALTASSLPINDNLVSRGLLNNPDLQFLFSQLDIPAGTQGPTPAFSPQENTPAPGANGTDGGTVAHVDTTGNVTRSAATGQDGDVVVEAGAQITSPASSTNVGGRVALIGPNVNNAGTISTPDGQTILAAGLQVGFVAHNANDPSLRGLDTYIGAITDPSLPTPEFTSGTATNLGLIGTLNALGQATPTPGADVTMAGANVNQSGEIDLSTSVSLNSRLDLLANYGTLPFFKNVAGFQGTTGFYPSAVGDVTLGANSLTQLVPDLTSTATVVGTQLALSSLVNIQASSIEMGNDSTLYAPSATLPSNSSQPALGVAGSVLTSGVTFNAGQWVAANNAEAFSSTGGQVTLDQGSTIDVSGSENVTASVAENIVKAQLLGTELANSPLQQDGSLRGDTIYIDLRNIGVYNGTAWIGTPLADVSGYANLVQHTVGELTTAGGTVAINAGGSVLMQAGSSVNVSGGWINYQGATVQTTNVTSNGQLINISQATPNLIYSGNYNGFTATQAKYGQSENFSISTLNGTQYDAGYIQGGNGGGLAILSPSMSLGGNLYGNTVAGPQQRTAASTYSSSSSAYAQASFLPTILSTLAVPKVSSLLLSFAATDSSGNPTDPVTPQNVDFGSTDSAGDLVLSPQLTAADGFGSLTINNPTGNITLPANTPLILPAGGSLIVEGANIDLESSITAPGGTLSFTAYEISPNQTVASLNIAPPTAGSPAGAVSATGNFTLGAGLSLETGGLTVNDFQSSTAGALPKLTAGGSVSINGYSVFLHSGSQIDTSGGVYVTPAGAVTYGAAGSISIIGGQDPDNTFLGGGQFLLGATLTGYSGLVGGGGSLTLQAPLVQVGGTLQQGLQNGDSNSGVVQESLGVYGNGNTLWLSPTGTTDFFSQGGFEKFAINGVGEKVLDSSGNQKIDSTTGDPLFHPAVLIAPGTQIQPVIQSYQLSSTGSLVPLTASQELQILPSQRSPANFSFTATGVTTSNPLFVLPGVQVRGDIVMGLGSSIATDPQDISSSNGVTFTASSGTVAILGQIIAPGGTISIKGASDSRAVLFADATDALTTVDLGSQSLLSTAGVVEYTANNFGFHTGSALSGGTISISGNIVAQQGAVLDVSGANGVIDVLPAQAGATSSFSLSAPGEISTSVASNAGSITFSGSQELWTDATLIGRACGLSAQGGTLSLSSGEISPLETPLDATLVVTQGGSTFVEPSGGQSMIGVIVNPTHSVLDVDGNPIHAYFAADPNIFASTSSDSGNGGQAGGFQSLNLGRTVAFSGSVSITTGRSISVAATTAADSISGGVIYADNAVVLSAPLVSLGLSFTKPSTTPENQQIPLFLNAFNPTYGPGTLTVNASTLTDIGNLSLQNIGSVNFNTTLANTPVVVTKNDPIAITGNGTISSSAGGTITSADGTTTTLVAGVATSVTRGSSITLAGDGVITPTTSGIIPSRLAGDIQGNGTLDVQGNVAMTAGQIFPPTESVFSIFAYDYNNVVGDSSVIFTRPLQSNALPSLPLSAGGTLNVYASNITQDGVLRAPDGSINLGLGVASSIPVDFFTGSGVAGLTSTTALAVPATNVVTLGSASITSVSMIDPTTGQGITIPYGIINNSGDWIDPAGNDVTSAGNGFGGLPAKSINVSGQNVADESGATIDLRGGGDLLAYQFVSGTGGTNDILASNSSFAVIPNYGLNYAPFAPYAVSTGLQTNGVADAGYANLNLAVGEQIYLNASSGLPAGVYTLLPARYAILPGAYLLKASSALISSASQSAPDGSTFVSGYVFNGLGNTTAVPPLYTEFQVESPSVVGAQADYQVSLANTYFPKTAATNNSAVPRLPMDAGQLVLSAGSLSLPGTSGSLLDTPAVGGLGGEVDIASSEAINIDNASDSTTVDSTPGVLNLDSTQLTEFGADSLLIGGYRTNGGATTLLTTTGSALVIPSSGGSITFPQGTPGDDLVTVSGTGVVGTYSAPGGGTTAITGGTATNIPAGSIVTLAGGGTVIFSGGTSGPIPVTVSVAGTGVSVTTSQLTVNNAGASLTGADVILVSNGKLTVDAGGMITGTTSSSSTAGSLALVGNGTLLRVSEDSTAQTSRSSVHASTGVDQADLEILSSSAKATSITGASVILDSTNQTSLGANVNLSGTSVALNSGQISLELTAPATVPATTGLVLSGQGLTNLQANAKSLSLLSYSSIDIYNDDLTTPGVIGAAPSQGVYPVGSLTLHTADIRGFGGGDDVINSQTVVLDNSSGSAALGAASGITSLSGSLTINAQTIQLGSNAVQVDQFASVNLNASGEVMLTGLGTQGAADTTPVASSFNVAGALNMDTPLISGTTAPLPKSSGQTSFIDEAITAQGAVSIANTGASSSIATDSGLGAELQVSGSSVADNGNIVLYSGTVTLSATGISAGSDVVIGSTGILDVSGLAPNIYNLTKYTNGGSATLSSAHGNVSVAGVINVSALSGVGTTDSGAGNAGTLAISAQNGTFTPGGTINGQAGVVSAADGTVLSQGNGGTFSLDVATLASGNLDAIEAVLNPATTGPISGHTYVGGFTQSQSIRLRNGSLLIDGVVAANTVNLSADNGNIEVASTGRIDASAPTNGLIDTTTVTQTENGEPVTSLANPGATGGAINLAASGSVTLDSGSLLSVAGLGFNDAGQGGSVTLQAGSDVQGSVPSTSSGRQSGGKFGSGVAVVNVQAGSTIDLSVKYLPIQLNTSGTSSITLAAPGAIYFPHGTPGNDQVIISGSGVVGTLVSASGATTPVTGGSLLAVPAGSTLNLSNANTVITFASGGTGGAVAVDLPSLASFASVGCSNLAGNAALTAADQGDLTGTLVLQAPQTANNSDVQIDPINGTVVQASSIVVAGLNVQNANSAGSISLDGSSGVAGNPGAANYEAVATQNAQTFTSDPNYQAMLTALVGSQSQGVSGLVQIRPAEEIDNTQGGLGLNSTWDFSQSRYGPGASQPGILILRAAGDLSVAFGASITDGFDTANPSVVGEAYTAPLMSGQSWSYNLVSGADFTSANLGQVVSGAGSFVLGQNSPALPTTLNTTAKSILSGLNFYQAIRTGTGSITINSGGSVQILNPLATIYTAGTVAPALAGFDLPFMSSTTAEGAAYSAQYSFEGGNLTISALGNIGHSTASGAADSSKELPTSWLYRQGATENGLFTANFNNPDAIESTSWWVNFSNFFEGVGTLGGGNISLTAGGSVVNIDASAPTNARMPGRDASGNPIAPNSSSLVELGGGDVIIQAGDNIDAGVYYVENGQGTLTAGNQIVTNSSRAALKPTGKPLTDPYSWLPTTLFAGDASFDISANGNLLLGPVANPFLLPQNVGNDSALRSYFSTYNTSDAINVSSLTGSVEIKDDPDSSGNTPGDGSLFSWYNNIFFALNRQSFGTLSQPWLQLAESGIVGGFNTVSTLMPATLRATAFSGDVNLVGSILLSPSPSGTVDLAAAGSVNGFQPNTISSAVANWGAASINLSDADPASIPGTASPLSAQGPADTNPLISLSALFAESGATQGLNLQDEQALHADINGDPLHAGDSNPVYIYAQNGDISGLTLFSGKLSDVVAGQDINDIALYIQNDSPTDISVVDAGRNLTAYDPNSALRISGQANGNILIGESSANALGSGGGAPRAGDIQISGPGTLEVLAGGNITLGDGPANTSGPNGSSDGTQTGFTSVGNLRNPALSSEGADIVGGAGLDGVTLGLSGAAPDQLGFAKFEDEFLNPNPTDPADDAGLVQADRYLPHLGTLLGLDNTTPAQIWTAFNQLSSGQQGALALQIYYLVLRDAGRDHNSSTAQGAGTYAAATEAIAALFPHSTYQGDISLSSREIKTESGGNINLFAPGGGIVVGFNLTSQPVDQGILTDAGGNINIYANNDVTVGTSRIFTLDGGNIVIYSANGNIAAGASSKTVQSAPPTRVLVSPQSGAVQTDLAGLATGGGIGVLESQAGAQAGDVDLIAPKGTVDAGDAGIRVSGNLNIAAVQVLNAGNISVGGKSAGVPTTTAPNLAGLSAASNAAGAGANEASDVARQQQQQSGGNPGAGLPSIITVEVLGYGGGDGA